MMTSARALEIVREQFPDCNIEEVPGNPNILGEFLFNVEGNAVFVSKDGDTIEEFCGPPEQF